MPVAVVLACIAALFAVAILAAAIGASAWANRTIYGASSTISAIAIAAALVGLAAGGAAASALTLPLGLLWLGAHFRIDALAAFFLVIVNLGAAATGLYGLGYGQHEHRSYRSSRRSSPL